MPCLLINADQIKELLSMKETLDACEEAFLGWGKGEVVCPPKINLPLGTSCDWPPYKNGLNAMPAYIHSQKSAGIKCVGGSLNNPGWGLPYIIALILLFDPETGIFRCVMDGEVITNYRTGAQAAVAAKYLTDKRRITLGIYGAGAQGRTQLMAFDAAFELEKIVVYDINSAAAEKYVTEMQKIVKAPIVIASSQQEPSTMDIVVSVTHSRDKFIRDEWIKPGQLVFPMGSFTECADELLLNADKIVVDSIEQTMHRGALSSVAEAARITENDIYATIGEVVAGVKPVTPTKGERIVCVPIGTGAMDVAVATVVYNKALKQHVGESFVFNRDVEVEVRR